MRRLLVVALTGGALLVPSSAQAGGVGLTCSVRNPYFVAMMFDPQYKLDTIPGRFECLQAGRNVIKTIRSRGRRTWTQKVWFIGVRYTCRNQRCSVHPRFIMTPVIYSNGFG